MNNRHKIRIGISHLNLIAIAIHLLYFRALARHLIRVIFLPCTLLFKAPYQVHNLTKKGTSHHIYLAVPVPLLCTSSSLAESYYFKVVSHVGA